MKKIIIHHRSSHHATYSGYAQLIDYLDDVEVISGENSILSERLARFIKSKSNPKYGAYDSNSAKKNEELIRKLFFLKKENTFIHYLNGERDIRQAIGLFGKKCKSVATLHKPPLVLEKSITDTKYLKKLNGVIAVGKNQVDFLKNWLNTDNVTYIPHGINTDFFVTDISKRKEKTVLFVGQHLRDFDALNYAIKNISEKKLNVHFNVVLRKDFAKNVITNSSVTVHSGIDDETLKHLYQQATVLFLPLTDVTACNSVLEAMSCGLPVITSDLEGNRGYGLNENNSWLIPKNNYSEFVDVIQEVVFQDNTEKSINIRKNALEYDWKKIAQKVTLFYR